MSASTNGTHHHEQNNNQTLSSTETQLLSNIQQALHVIHNPHTDNDSRQAASSYLETVKSDEAAPYHGFLLANDQSQSTIIRHFALSLLEHAIRHRWSAYTDEQGNTLKEWIIQLSRQISANDPAYIRTKTAQLWSDLAKRSWGVTWLDMNDLLVDIWNNSASPASREFVLTVLETLADDIFSGDDTIVVLNESTLKMVCLEIFVPAHILKAHKYPGKTDDESVTSMSGSGNDWLSRIGNFLDELLGESSKNESSVVQLDKHEAVCAKKCLDVYRSTMPWILSQAIEYTRVVRRCRFALTSSSISVQMVAIDAFNALYLRPQFSQEEFEDFVVPMYSGVSVDLLHRLFFWSIEDSDPNNIDSEKYTLSKKLSEMLAVLGNFIDIKDCPHPNPDEFHFPALLNLFLLVCQNTSLVISIPILCTWSRLLNNKKIIESGQLDSFLADLLGLCSDRQLRYESLPEDSEDPSMLFLREDLDTIPERHAFLGNYRRFGIQIIDSVIKRKRVEATVHVLSQAKMTIERFCGGNDVAFSYEHYSKHSSAILQIEAQCSVVEALLRAHLKWKAQADMTSPADVQDCETMESGFEKWCSWLLELDVVDPLIKKRLWHLLVVFATSALDKRSDFILNVLQALFTQQPVLRPECLAYSDAVKEFQGESFHELIRLARKLPDRLLEVYDALESKINELLKNPAVLDVRAPLAYKTFLFSIILRAHALNIDPETRMARLRQFIDPVKQQWQDMDFQAAVSTVETFNQFMGLTKARGYIIQRQVHKLNDWSTFKLDSEGLAIQNEIDNHFHVLPLRTTNGYLSCSSEKAIDKSIHATARRLWQDAIPLIFPSLLKLIGYSHAFHSPNHWAELPAEMQPIVGRILNDRFWQAGISGGSKDEFYINILATKTTMEGLASSMRSCVRHIRDHCYKVLWIMSDVNEELYSTEQLPGLLAEAMFENAHHLSSHQLMSLLLIVKHLVDNCPVRSRSHFLPIFLSTCLAKVDLKITSDWERLGQTQVDNREDDDLAEEMKEESILRQLTYSAVQMIVDYLKEPQYHPSNGPPLTHRRTPAMDNSLRGFCLTNQTIVEPLLIFTSHAIRYRDTRSCAAVLSILRSIVPTFATTSSPPSYREFISRDILQACITSLHEPHFVEIQRDLAQLIATIIQHFTPLTTLPQDTLLSLPTTTAATVSNCVAQICTPEISSRRQRALVLDLLADLKGVSVSELGRVSASLGDIKRERSKMQKEFMKVDEEVVRGKTPDLEGLSGMFGEQRVG